MTLGAENSTRISPKGTEAVNLPSAMDAKAVGDFPSIGTNRTVPSWSGWPSRVTVPFTVPVVEEPEQPMPPTRIGARKRRESRRVGFIARSSEPDQKSPITSPPFMVPKARQVARPMLLVTNCTWPSPNNTLTPPACRLRAALCAKPEPALVQGGLLGETLSLQ